MRASDVTDIDTTPGVREEDGVREAGGNDTDVCFC